MAILNIKKNKSAAVKESKNTKKLSVVANEKTPAVVGSKLPHIISGNIIIRPRVTEKAAVLSEKQGRQVCVFEVSARANSRTVAEAVMALYKVVPVKVAVLRVPPKKSFVKGRVSYGKTGYKAYVYLKKGDSIEIA
jgi:ribosomal protein L23